MRSQAQMQFLSGQFNSSPKSEAMEADRSQTISNSPKPGTVALEVESAESIRPLALDAVDDISDKEWRRIVHKIDRRLITATGLMMAVSLMDRTNLGSAMIAGMSKDLGMSIGNRYVGIVLLS